MKNLLSIPTKVTNALFDAHYDSGDDLMARFFMVVEAKSGKPQHFVTNNSGKYCDGGLGVFLDAYPEGHSSECFPVEIFDRETALFLIGQDSIYRSLSVYDFDEKRKKAPVFELMPIFSPLMPNCIISTPTK